ncbi:MAG: DNA-3-methyladenine glycosylase [Chloroflexota bacterium]|nr:MAG: DNA-3-methyladenine glycosylase [Chloroflexota bacterium]
MIVLQQEFYARPTLTVARELLGQRLVRELDGQRLSGLIVETEAYIGPDDSASHAYRKRNSDRAQVMFGPPGRTYVYFIYGMYFMLNLVTEAEGFPAAVLIRAIEPQEGIDHMQTNRFPSPRLTCPRMGVASSMPRLTNGPAKLCQALRIDKKLNNWDLTQGQALWLEAAPTIPADAITTGPRIGIDYAQPEDRAAPWRFWLWDNPFVSKR